MKYQFVSLAESGNGVDFIILVERQPNVWQELLGRCPERLAFFGPRPQWITMEGIVAPRRVERVLNRFWNEHRPEKSEHASAAALTTRRGDELHETPRRAR
jgi:hypothetical protein